MPLDQLWAAWRSNYVRRVSRQPRRAFPRVSRTTAVSLFERILGSGAPDARPCIVHRGETCFVILNRFPYTSGHLMVLPNRAVADLEDLDTAEESRSCGTWFATRWWRSRRAMRCQGVNVGLNLGAVAGGSQADHLHVHAVPRWQGDANFMSVAGETRLLPVGLEETWEAIRGAWPES